MKSKLSFSNFQMKIQIFICLCICIITRNCRLTQGYKDFLLFSFRNIIILTLTFRSMIYSKLINVWGVKQSLSSFFLFYEYIYIYSLVPVRFVSKTIIFLFHYLHTFVKISCTYTQSPFLDSILFLQYFQSYMIPHCIDVLYII